MFYITILLLAWHGLPWTKSTPMKEKVFLLVFDGFVHDFEKLTTNMPNFQKLASEGVKAKGLIPPFPSSTWPSMITLSTGLYPESHGIIDNGFFDEEGTYFKWDDDPNNRTKAKAYTQEPIWLSNQLQKGRSSVYYWPGYYAFDEKPYYHNSRITPYGANITVGRQAIDETFESYEKDPTLNFMVLYVEQPDVDGHRYGVTSQEYREQIENLDKYVLGYLMAKIEHHPELNLIVLADHGQINVNPRKHIRYMSDYFDDFSMFQRPPDCGTYCRATPAEGYTGKDIFAKLKPLFDETGAFRYFDQGDPDKQIPEYLHASHHRLIPPLLILPDPGWWLLDKHWNLTELEINYPNYTKIDHGTHGYDPYSCREMQTIFFASGPAFKKGVTMEAFDNVNVYPLLAHLLGIKPRPNNGTLTIFKHVLKDWKPKEDIGLPGKHSAKAYALIFVACLLSILLVLTSAYFMVRHVLRRLFGPRAKQYTESPKRRLAAEDRF
uniref:Uncharacterized protein n=1 Tax=Clytia hemisphaerica TaxID=252671 RepID=A0A7M5WLL2_9CNID